MECVNSEREREILVVGRESSVRRGSLASRRVSVNYGMRIIRRPVEHALFGSRTRPSRAGRCRSSTLQLLPFRYGFCQECHSGRNISNPLRKTACLQLQYCEGALRQDGYDHTTAFLYYRISPPRRQDAGRKEATLDCYRLLMRALFSGQKARLNDVLHEISKRKLFQTFLLR